MWEGALIGGTVKDYLTLPHSTSQFPQDIRRAVRLSPRALSSRALCIVVMSPGTPTRPRHGPTRRRQEPAVGGGRSGGRKERTGTVAAATVKPSRAHFERPPL